DRDGRRPLDGLPRVPPSRADGGRLEDRDRPLGLGALDPQDGGAADRPPPYALDRLVRVLELKGLDLGAHGHLRGESKELLAVLAGEVRNRADRALAPEEVVGEGG